MAVAIAIEMSDEQYLMLTENITDKCVITDAIQDKRLVMQTMEDWREYLDHGYKVVK